MEIWHRVCFNKYDEVDAQLDALKIKYKRVAGLRGYYLIVFEIGDLDSRWPRIAELMRQKNAADFSDALFTAEEIRSSEWLRLIPLFEKGYPQPESDWSKNPLNYKNHCPKCGVFEQVASFRIRQEPNLEKQSFMILYWTCALFCTPEVFTELVAHGIEGYEQWDAILHKADVPSQRVSQLFIPHVAAPGLVLQPGELEEAICPVCGVVKYVPHKKGVMHFKRDALVPGVDIMQTHEWFGSGGMAYREILVSNRVASLILDKKWQGVRLKVVELV
jgi:hypothetical protein